MADKIDPSQIDKSMPAMGEELMVEGEDQEIEEDEEESEGDIEVIEEEEDGSVVVNFEGAIQKGMAEEHDANLAEMVDVRVLQDISSDLISDYEGDKESRSDWENAYSEGLELLGIKYEEREEPFRGSSGVTHPLISEAVTQFQAQAYKELLPSAGPVRTQVLGANTPEVENQAQRVQDFMNYQIVHVMEEYDPELDRLLFYLPLSGSAFKKVYFDETLDRAVSRFVPADDLVVPYNATDLYSATRVTHVLRVSGNEIRINQSTGFYRDVELQPYEEEDQVKDKERELSGVEKNSTDEDYTLLEVHTNNV